LRSNQLDKNIASIQRVIGNHQTEFTPILERCPLFYKIIAHAFIFRVGLRVQDVDWTSSLEDWNDDDCQRIGRSIATFLRRVEVSLI